MTRKMEDLPIEILGKILNYVDSKTLILNVPGVCKNWNWMCQNYLIPDFSGNPEEWKKRFNYHKYIKDDYLELVMKRFSKAFAVNNTYWIDYAVKRDKLKCFQFLMRTNPNINHVYTNGYTLLDYAVCSTMGKVDKYIKPLLENKANPNTENGNGFTPLSISCCPGFFDVAKLLIENKADVNYYSDNCGTALFNACNSGHINIVNLLVESKANIHIGGGDACSPIEVAMEKNYTEIVSYLLSSQK